MMQFIKNSHFWRWALGVGIVSSLFFAWELGAFRNYLWSLPRMEPSTPELLFVILMTGLLAFAAGLLGYRTSMGKCPIGARNASAIAGTLSAVTLLCPVCLLLPFSLFGVSLSLALLTPYMPLLRVITLLLLAVSITLLWPKNLTRKS